MGNRISCKITKPSFKNSKSTKVILPTGEIRQIQQPTKVAELMMEVPNFFIVNVKSLKIGRRFCPLNADDDLAKANVYIMFPMQRKNSVVTAGDMSVMFLATNSFLKRASKANIRILPESRGSITVPVTEPRLSLEGIEEVSTPEFRHRMSMSRSKKPLLETIEEEPSRSKLYLKQPIRSW